MREQVCTYMCPWPRIQAAMIDHDSLSATYRAERGEPRGAHKKGDSWEGRGDCIDCRQCVAVCPMGIDIRDGFQLECINCGLCADACNSIMDRVERPRGLISYVAASAAERPRPRFIRPRTILYASLVLLVGALMVYGLVTRATFGAELIRDRNPAFVRLSDGSIRNGYTIRIANMRAARDIIVSLDYPAPITLHAIGADISGVQAKLHAVGDTVTSAHLFVAIPAASTSEASKTIRFTIRDARTGETVSKTSAFLTGAP
jgi:cytochrome c oxidase accessory protein FixG